MILINLKKKIFNSKKFKTLVNQYYCYFIFIYHFIAFIFPFPIYKIFFKIIGLKIGSYSTLNYKVYIKFPWLVIIKDYVSIQRNCELYSDFFNNAKITIGNRVRCGPNVKFYAGGHVVNSDLNKTKRYLHEQHYGSQILIEDNVWIGANTIILPGVTIKKNSVVAAGSVVNKNIPANVMAAGVPARVIKYLK
jgi:maltose O-acetyltransferase